MHPMLRYIALDAWRRRRVLLIAECQEWGVINHHIRHECYKYCPINIRIDLQLSFASVRIWVHGEWLQIIGQLVSHSLANNEEHFWCYLGLYLELNQFYFDSILMLSHSSHSNFMYSCRTPAVKIIAFLPISLALHYSGSKLSICKQLIPNLWN